MDDTLSLTGRAAIVTGAGNGLGRAEALALAAAGARLVLNDLAGDDVHAVADEITAAGGQAVVRAGDIGEWATGEQLVAAALQVRAIQPDASRSRRALIEPLTPTQLRILKLLPTSTIPQIAAALYMSRNTVKTHLKAIYQRLGAGTRSEAIQRAIVQQLL